MHAYIHTIDLTKMTVACGVSHKHAKYTKYARHTEVLQYKYYTYFIYRIMDHRQTQRMCQQSKRSVYLSILLMLPEIVPFRW